MKLATSLLFFGLVTGSAQADEPSLLSGFSEAQIEKIAATAQSAFWDNAVGEDGKHFIPRSEEERTSRLIPAQDASRVVKEAHLYGLARWCGLDWQPTYLDYMQVERRRPWDQKQIAYIGLLFGLAQGVMPNWIGRECEASERETIAAKMAAEKSRLKSKR